MVTKPRSANYPVMSNSRWNRSSGIMPREVAGFSAWVREYFLPKSVETGSGTHPASYSLPTGIELSPGAERPRREVVYSFI
jgi:hypothetical protein